MMLPDRPVSSVMDATSVLAGMAWHLLYAQWRSMGPWDEGTGTGTYAGSRDLDEGLRKAPKSERGEGQGQVNHKLDVTHYRSDGVSYRSGFAPYTSGFASFPNSVSATLDSFVLHEQTLAGPLCTPH